VMCVSSSDLVIGSLALTLNRKAIKNLHISVLPPDGRIRVSAPEKMTDTAIRMAVIKRIPWIKKQKQSFINQPRQSARQMMNGESHYLWGQRYRLEVIEQYGRHRLAVKGVSKLVLKVSPNTSTENRLRVLEDYYRAELKQRIPVLLEKWLPRLGVTLSDWRVQKMKTQWGSCHVENKRILLNLELAKKPAECLEYILVHELVHLLERKHSERFKTYMDQYRPNWQEVKYLLNRSHLRAIDGVV